MIDSMLVVTVQQIKRVLFFDKYNNAPSIYFQMIIGYRVDSYFTSGYKSECILGTDNRTQHDNSCVVC